MNRNKVVDSPTLFFPTALEIGNFDLLPKSPYTSLLLTEHLELSCSSAVYGWFNQPFALLQLRFLYFNPEQKSLDPGKAQTLPKTVFRSMSQGQPLQNSVISKGCGV